MSYIAQGLNNYTKTYSNKRTGFSVGYYTVSQVKALYPQGDYQVAAQIGAGVKKMRRIRWPTMEKQNRPLLTRKIRCIARLAISVAAKSSLSR